MSGQWESPEGVVRGCLKFRVGRIVGDLRYNWVSARMDAIDVTEMRELVLDAWSMVVPKRVADQYVERLQ